jgi:hypothetical protein
VSAIWRPTNRQRDHQNQDFHQDWESTTRTDKVETTSEQGWSGLERLGINGYQHFTSDSVVDLLTAAKWRTTTAFQFDANMTLPTFRVCAAPFAKNVSTSKSSKHVLVIYTKLRRAGAVECPLCGKERAFETSLTLPWLVWGQFGPFLIKRKKGSRKWKREQKSSRKRKSKW